ncbi:armadillo-type protein, partial [Tribonema minus]
VLTDATQELALLLRQQSRPLKQAALEALLALLRGNAARMDGALLARVVAEAAPLVSDADLHLAHLALQACAPQGKVCCSAYAGGEQASLLRKPLQPCIRSAKEVFEPNVLEHQLQNGPALASLLDLLRALVAVDAAGLRFNDLLAMLHGTAKGGGGAAPAPRQAIGNLAQCVAAVCAAAKESERAATVAGLLRDARGADEARCHLSLLALAELATLADLSAVANLKELLLGTFDDAACSEEARTAAAYALGRLAVGSRDVYLPVVLDALESTRHQYLLLSSLKEVIVCHARARPPLDFSAALDQVLPHLFGHCQSPEEGVRNMVAACLGALATMHPDRVVPALLEALANAGGEELSDALARWTVATALKHCMAGDAPIAALSPHMRTFLALLNDPDLDVRRGALLLANAAIHHQPALVEDLLAEVITPVLLETVGGALVAACRVRFADVITPVLLQTVELKMERVVDLGPFKHRVDDAEPLRKAALACIDTILDVMPERLDEVALMPHLAKGLADSKPDVQTLCHQILAKLCDLRPGAVLNSMDTLITPLEKAVNKPAKENQVGTEVERANDLVRSALRCVAAMSRLEEIEASHKLQGPGPTLIEVKYMQISRSFVEFRERLLKKEKLAALYESVTSERIAVEA